jgi:hypothetical protein
MPVLARAPFLRNTVARSRFANSARSVHDYHVRRFDRY